ncbi:MAG: sensor histidine kinase [Burkholderiaceae bacterium]
MAHSVFNRLSFWVTRHSDYAVALQACMPSLTHAFLPLSTSAAISTLGLAITGALVSFGKRKKASYLQIPETSGVWALATGCYLASAICIYLVPNSASVGLTATLTSVLCLLLYERNARRRLAFKRVARRRLQHRAWQAERKRLEGQWNERLRWLAGIQHDMRQPLHALGLLIIHPAMQNDGRFANLVIQLASCQRWLHELAENAMEATRIQLDNDIAGCYAACPVGELLIEMSPWIKPLADFKGLALEISADEGQVQTDVRRLKRVLTNLVHNAVRHTEQGRVWLNYHMERGGVHCFEIGDTGPGLPADVIDQLSEKGPQSRVNLPKRGLGLYVAKNFCTELGWQLEIHHSGSSGTLFTLRVLDCITAQRLEQNAA